jgi:hypothetical protein
MEDQEKKELIEVIAVYFYEWANDLRKRSKRPSILDIEEFMMWLADYDEEIREEFRKAIIRSEIK